MKTRSIVILAILWFYLLPNYGNACSCSGQSTVEQEFKHADLVATGKVISKSIVLVYDSLWLHDFKTDSVFAKTTISRYLISISKLYKGKLSGDTLIIYSGIGGGDCGINFKVGDEYIIYGEKETYLSNKDSGINYPTEKNSYWTYVCLRTGLVEKNECSELEKLVAPQSGNQKQIKKEKVNKRTKSEIAKQVSLTDSLRFSKALTLKEFNSISECAKTVSCYYNKDSLKYIYSFNGIKFYSSLLHVYFKNNEIIKISFYEQTPELEKHFKSYKKEDKESLNKITYKDATYIFYFTNPVEMYELKEGKEVKRKLDTAKLNQVLQCINILKEEAD